MSTTTQQRAVIPIEGMTCATCATRIEKVVGRLEGVSDPARKISELEQMRATLLHLIKRCHGDDRPDCPIIDELAKDGKET